MLVDPKDAISIRKHACSRVYTEIHNRKTFISIVCIVLEYSTVMFFPNIPMDGSHHIYDLGIGINFLSQESFYPIM